MLCLSLTTAVLPPGWLRIPKLDFGTAGRAVAYTPRRRGHRERNGSLKDDILPRLGAGDPGAAEECLDRYGPLVWSLARRHTRIAAEAEDAVQEIFVALWKNASRFDPSKASEPTFVTMIARRRLIDLHRYKERRPESKASESELETIPDLKAGAIENRAEARQAVRAIQQLKPKEREAILLSVYQGMSHSEISTHMELPLGTVKTYIRRGLTRVREMLAGGGAPLEGEAT